MKISEVEASHLVALAKDMTKMSYAPYSHFHVGAALIDEEGGIFTGCNIENASYGATNCAERTAIFKAVSEGHTRLKAIAIAGGHEGVVTEACPPCGICRQVMTEFFPKDADILLATVEGYEAYTLEQIMPLSFDLLDK